MTCWLLRYNPMIFNWSLSKLGLVMHNIGIFGEQLLRKTGSLKLLWLENKLCLKRFKKFE